MNIYTFTEIKQVWTDYQRDLFPKIHVLLKESLKTWDKREI